MPDLKSEIRTLVESFVEDLNKLVRQSAIDAAVDALRGTSSSSEGANRRSATKQGRGVHRRSPSEILRTETKVVAYIEKHPGQRSEDIRKALKLSPSVTGDALKRLVSKKALRSKGQRRATTYSKG